MSDTIKAKNEGTSRVYEASFDRTWEAAEAVLHEAGAGAIEEHKDDHYMSTELGAGAFSWGTYVTAWIDPIGGGKLKVTVVAKKRAKMTIQTQLGEPEFLAKLDTRLASR